MALLTASGHASRGDVTATVANLSRATLFEAHARLAERRQWALNEKGLVARAGLTGVDALLGRLAPTALAGVVAEVGAKLEIEPRRLREP
jgi:hypothetical protein